MAIIGYIVLCVVLLVVRLIGWQRQDSPWPSARGHILIVLYCSLGYLAFVHIPKLRQFFSSDGSTPELLSPAFQAGVALNALNLLLQALAIVKTRTLFNRAFSPLIINLIVGPCSLFLTGIGIIGVTWLVIFSGLEASLILVSAVYALLRNVILESSSITDRDQRKEVLTTVRDELNRFLTFALTSLLALGGSLGVSMTILFREGRAVWSSTEFLTLAFQMVFGYALVCLGIVVWLGKPYLDTFVAVREYLRGAPPIQWDES